MIARDAINKKQPVRLLGEHAFLEYPNTPQGHAGSSLKVQDCQVPGDRLGPAADLEVRVLDAVCGCNLLDVRDLLDVALLVGNFKAGLHLLRHNPKGQEAQPGQATCKAAGNG